MNKKPAIFLCGHGSRDPETLGEFDALLAGLRSRLPDHAIGHGFLEFSKPTIVEGLTHLHREGAEEIRVLPLTLFQGKHASQDIPALLDDFGARHQGLVLRYGRGLGVEKKLAAIVADRINAAQTPTTWETTFLLLVARGSAKAETGNELQNMAAGLKGRFGFAGGLAAFSGLAEPSVTDALKIAQQSGATRILVVPYFLFTGKLLKDLHKATSTAAAKAKIEFFVTAHLFGHPLLEEALIARVLEMTPRKARA